MDDLQLNVTEEMKSETADFEVDELCTYVRKKMKSETADFEVDELCTCTYVRKKKNKVWLWMVYHRQTKQIVSFQLGCRETCQKLRNKLMKLGIKGKIHTDLWKAYAAVFPKNQHIAHEQRGRTNHIERFNGMLRSRVSRLVSKTYWFAKSYRNLFLSLRFCIAEHNKSLH